LDGLKTGTDGLDLLAFKSPRRRYRSVGSGLDESLRRDHQRAADSNTLLRANLRRGKSMRHLRFPSCLAGRVAIGLLLRRSVAGSAMALHGWSKIQQSMSWMGADPGVPGFCKPWQR